MKKVIATLYLNSEKKCLNYEIRIQLPCLMASLYLAIQTLFLTIAREKVHTKVF